MGFVMAVKPNGDSTKGCMQNTSAHGKEHAMLNVQERTCMSLQRSAQPRVDPKNFALGAPSVQKRRPASKGAVLASCGPAGRLSLRCLGRGLRGPQEVLYSRQLEPSVVLSRMLGVGSAKCILSSIPGGRRRQSVVLSSILEVGGAKALYCRQF